MTSTPSTLTVLIAGLGALGTVYGALLQKAGHRVYALTKDRYLGALSDRRVRVGGIWGEHEAVLEGIAGSIGPFMRVNFDLIVFTVKSYDTVPTIEQVKPLCGRRTLTMVAQNGYGNYEAVSDSIGREHTLLARVIFGARLHAPGRAEVTVIADDVRIGQPHNAVARDRIEQIAAVCTAAGIPTSFAADVNALLWDKILYNASLNPLGAILECTYGQLAEQEGARQVMDSVIDEIFAVAQARGIRLNWSRPQAYREHFYGKLIPPTASHFPSMYYDVKAGKRLEVDALNGAIVRLAEERGLRAPVNETLVGIIRAKEFLAAAKQGRMPNE